MQWLELTITAPPEYVEPLEQLFRRYGNRTVALEQEGGFNPDEGEAPPPGPVTLRMYLPWNRRARTAVQRIDVGVRLISQLHPLPPLAQRLLQEAEWQEEWKKHFRVLHVGRSLVVCPLWIAYVPKPMEKVVLLDPGMAFGTGQHPTTRMCLEELERSIRPGMRVLDVGTGSGILAVAAARLGAASVLAVDPDAEAIRAARRNINLNGLTIVVRVLRGSVPLQAPERYPLVLANLSARILQSLADALAQSLAPGGRLIASGFLQETAGPVGKGLQTAGLRAIHAQQEGDWLTQVFQAPG